MKINFKYDEDRDIDCLLSKGPGSTNSPGEQTVTYQKLLNSGADINDREQVRNFVRKFITDNNININQNLAIDTENWLKIEPKFANIAEKVFGLKLDDNITAFLTITGRFPYGTDYFYVSAKSTEKTNNISTHELWHFYTWKKFGYQQEIIGDIKYNDIKESLSVILNIECKELLGDKPDLGYPQHKELRERILEMWNQEQNIEKIWNELIK